ncbi:MAG: HD domain-containing protein [Syntrophobacterales bacterium]|nr:HD domain-containing protein [Syntrophobacterales bacterium]
MGKVEITTESIQEFRKAIAVRKIDLEDARLQKDFIPIEIQDISSQDLLPFSIYFPFAGEKEPIVFKKIVEAGSFFNSRWKTIFRENNIEHAYVHVNEFDLYIKYLNSRLIKTLENPYLSRDKKHEILYRNASYVMQRILDNPRSGKNIQMGIDLADTLSTYIAKNEVTASMIARLFSKNYELFSHCIQVSLLSAIFCRFLKKDQREIFICSTGALLHDIGKIDIPQEILLKEEKLSEEEFSIIKKHPEMGVKILEQYNGIEKEVIEIVLQHHENADGSGYPQGLTIDEISPMAQIVRIIDCYDSLTTQKAYKAAIKPFEALRKMVLEMKWTFNTRLLELFIVFLGY